MLERGPFILTRISDGSFGRDLSIEPVLDLSGGRL